MKSRIFALILAAGATVPVFGQNVQIERAPGDGPVHPGQPVCILAAMAHPDDEVANGSFSVTKNGTGYWLDSVSASRQSPTSVKLCGSFNASFPSGSYQVQTVRLGTPAGKYTDSMYPTDFHQVVTIEFVNDSKKVPVVNDIKRVPAQ